MDERMSPRSVAAKEAMMEEKYYRPVPFLQAPPYLPQPQQLELPPFVPGLVIEILGYPYALGAMAVCQGWRRQGERLFAAELAELRCVVKCEASYLSLPATTKSTISIAFSPDHNSFASTHGDHTVKVVDFQRETVIATLVGHPRTPWTVKFHPSDPDILASGCLGFEARIWRVSSKECVARADFDRAIISLTFHPKGDVLAVAAGQSIYLWDYNSGAPPLREYTHAFPIRCLRFLSTTEGSKSYFIVGAANGGGIPAQPAAAAAGPPQAPPPAQQPAVPPPPPPPPAGQQQQQQQQQRARHRPTFSLMMCELDIEVARDGARDVAALSTLTNPQIPVAGTGRAITKEPRSVLKHALFYNDGGFDLSPCGSFLCSCADLWVPDDAATVGDHGDVSSPEEEEDLVAPPSATTVVTRVPSAKMRRRQREDDDEDDYDDYDDDGDFMDVDRHHHRSTPRAKRRGRPCWDDAPRGERTTSDSPLDSSDDDYEDDRLSLCASGGARVRRRRLRATLDVFEDNDDDDRYLEAERLLQRPSSEMITPVPASRNLAPSTPPDPIPMVISTPSPTIDGYADVLPSRYEPLVRPPPLRRRRPQPTTAPASATARGRYQPHLVVVSLRDKAPNPKTGEEEGRLIRAAPLDERSFAGASIETAGSDIVTSVKLSPTASLVLLGNSRGGDGTAGDGLPRIVSVVFRVGDMLKIKTRRQVGDDVNIALFHPSPGTGLVYGTKQGRICKMYLPERSSSSSSDDDAVLDDQGPVDDDL